MYILYSYISNRFSKFSSWIKNHTFLPPVITLIAGIALIAMHSQIDVIRWIVILIAAPCWFLRHSTSCG